MLSLQFFHFVLPCVCKSLQRCKLHCHLTACGNLNGKQWSCKYLFKMIILFQNWVHPIIVLKTAQKIQFHAWTLSRKKDGGVLVIVFSQRETNYTKCNAFQITVLLKQIKAVERLGTIWSNGTLVHDFLPNLIIFFHFSPTWLRNL